MPRYILNMKTLESQPRLLNETQKGNLEVKWDLILLDFCWQFICTLSPPPACLCPFHTYKQQISLNGQGLDSFTRQNQQWSPHEAFVYLCDFKCVFRYIILITAETYWDVMIQTSHVNKLQTHFVSHSGANHCRFSIWAQQDAKYMGKRWYFKSRR